MTAKFSRIIKINQILLFLCLFLVQLKSVNSCSIIIKTVMLIGFLTLLINSIYYFLLIKGKKLHKLVENAKNITTIGLISFLFFISLSQFSFTNIGLPKYIYINIIFPYVISLSLITCVILNRINKLFYSLLILSLIIHVFPNKWKMGLYTPNLLGYGLILFIIIVILLLIFIIIKNIYTYGFLKGIKEISLNVIAFLIAIILGFTITNIKKNMDNKIILEVQNKTGVGISNFKILGRNALSEIDTLGPNEKETIIFKGRSINRKTDNDYENEIIIKYFRNNMWKEKKILKGFSRWRILPQKLKIEIYKKDSIVFLNLKE
tara:strand:+ start:325 stop:1284 length:960 start_codon:yes stop_codon:yes gene_type:complete